MDIILSFINLILLVVILVIVTQFKKSGSLIRIEQKHVYIPVNKNKPRKKVRTPELDEDDYDIE